MDNYVCYTKRFRGEDGKMHGTTVYLHRWIFDEQGYDIKVDHMNHDKLDNRRENLRVTNHNDNCKNRYAKNKNNKSGYRNVFWNNSIDKWSVRLCRNHKSINIGDYDDVDEAGRIAEESRQKYYGKFAGRS